MGPQTHRVLIVEDCPDTALSMAIMLNMWGLESVIAYDGHSALEQIEKEQPKIILLDLWLPDMSGAEVAERLRKRNLLRDVAIIVLSGSASEKDRADLREVGMHPHLVKPVEPDVLHRLLTSYVKEYRPMHPRALAKIVGNLDAAADVLEAFENRNLQKERGWNFDGWRYEVIPWGVRFIYRDVAKQETQVLATLASPTRIITPNRGVDRNRYYFAETALETD